MWGLDATRPRPETGRLQQAEGIFFGLREEAAVRRLGASDVSTHAVPMIFSANGNNIVLKGDMQRRAIQCYIDPRVEAPEQRVNLSIGTYPQLFLDNPTRSVPRGVVAPGPNFYLPFEINGRIGPIRFDGEVGYNFGNHALPQSWGRGLIVGHEFSDRTEAYVELYDQQDANRIRAGQGVGNFASGGPKQRETTLGVGGSQAVNKAGTLNLLLMWGRSFQAVSVSNSQPSWIAWRLSE